MRTTTTTIIVNMIMLIIAMMMVVMITITTTMTFHGTSLDFFSQSSHCEVIFFHHTCSCGTS